MRITGKIEIGGVESEFELYPSGYPGKYRQEGADIAILGGRVELLAGMADAAISWAEEHLCRTCNDCLIDDGEGFDGECGDCADRSEARRQEKEHEDG